MNSKQNDRKKLNPTHNTIAIGNMLGIGKRSTENQ